MAELTEHEEYTARHDGHNILAYESNRLTAHNPVELAITARYLLRHIPSGAGHYAELLARHGCSVHLVDIMAPLLDAASERFGAAGLSDRLLSVERALTPPDGGLAAVSTDDLGQCNATAG